MQFTWIAFLLACSLLAAMLVCLELGHRLGTRRALREGEPEHAGFGIVEGAVFALLGLLMAFTFSGALSRFDERRKLIVDEANAIGTAYLRIDLLPAAAQGELRAGFRGYLDARLAAYRAVLDFDAVEAKLAHANEASPAIASTHPRAAIIAAASRDPPPRSAGALPIAPRVDRRSGSRTGT